MDLQEHFANDAWALLIACNLMSRVSSAETKKRCIGDFFARYPTPSDALEANPREAVDLINGLGLFESRFRSILDISEKFLQMSEFDCSLEKESKIYGIGDFGVASFNIWCRGLGHSLHPNDKNLASFCDWLRREHPMTGAEAEEGKVKAEPPSLETISQYGQTPGLKAPKQEEEEGGGSSIPTISPPNGPARGGAAGVLLGKVKVEAEAEETDVAQAMEVPGSSKPTTGAAAAKEGMDIKGSKGGKGGKGKGPGKAPGGQMDITRFFASSRPQRLNQDAGLAGQNSNPEGFIGVYADGGKRWRAQIQRPKKFNGTVVWTRDRRRFLGSFVTTKEAAEAYDAAARAFSMPTNFTGSKAMEVSELLG